MKVRDLSFGDRFILDRTGESYTLLSKYFYKGKPTSRYLVKPDKPHWMDGHEQLRPSLNHQCEVTPIN
jgi:hypothetical protein